MLDNTAKQIESWRLEKIGLYQLKFFLNTYMSKDFAGFKTLDEREKNNHLSAVCMNTECLHLSAICTNAECLFNFILRKMEKIQQSLIFLLRRVCLSLKGLSSRTCATFKVHIRLRRAMLSSLSLQVGQYNWLNGTCSYKQRFDRAWSLIQGEDSVILCARQMWAVNTLKSALSRCSVPHRSCFSVSVSGAANCNTWQSQPQREQQAFWFVKPLSVWWAVFQVFSWKSDSSVLSRLDTCTQDTEEGSSV